MDLSRRMLLQVAAALGVTARAQGAKTPRKVPLIALEIGDSPLAVGAIDDAGIRRMRQLGVDASLSGGPKIPWQEDELRARMDKLRQGGLVPYNMMIGGFPNTLYGRPGRDEEIENVQKSLRAAGKVGLPVVEYNFYAHRAMEGYYEEIGRAGASYTAFDYDRMKDLPPLETEGAHTAEEMWKN